MDDPERVKPDPIVAAKEDESQNIAHHGPPILDMRDLGICEAMILWIKVVRKAYSEKEWLPGPIDIRKSRLFWRLRSGKSPLPEAPPTAYSCPWYEIIEEDRPHWAFEMHVRDGIAYLAQCGYRIESTDPAGKPQIVTFNKWRFRVWEDAPPYPQTDPNFKGVWVQRVLEAGEKEAQDALAKKNPGKDKEKKEPESEAA